jgi:hypothetical protein
MGTTATNMARTCMTTGTTITARTRASAGYWSRC